jgi:metallo-beta-lactamase class B
VYGNTYYVGTQGLGSVLITSQDGHVLIDGALPDSATQIAANIRTLGFRVEDVKVILNSHVHFDHAGGIASLQKLTGAQVAASAIAAKVLMSGKVDSSDPQFGGLPDIPTIATVREIKHGETLKVGSLELTAHFTPGHTPGGTTWSWRSCEQQRCLNVVYVDSLNPISTTGYLYSDPKRNPNGVQQLEGSFKVVEALPCDVLIAPHPDLIDLFGKLAKRDRGEGNAFIDANACRNYAQMARDRLTKRLAEERNR